MGTGDKMKKILLLFSLLTILLLLGCSKSSNQSKDSINAYIQKQMNELIPGDFFLTVAKLVWRLNVKE